MENTMIIALWEIEDRKFDSLTEALQEYTQQEILDIWLKWEGISGYTRKILAAMNDLYDAEIKISK